MPVSELRKSQMRAYYHANKERILIKRREYERKNKKAIRLSVKLDLPMFVVRKMIAQEQK